MNVYKSIFHDQILADLFKICENCETFFTQSRIMWYCLPCKMKLFTWYMDLNKNFKMILQNDFAITYAYDI